MSRKNRNQQTQPVVAEEQATPETQAAPETEKKVTKSQRIRELTAEGKTTSQIAKELGLRYQHVYNVQHQQLKGRGASAVTAE